MDAACTLLARPACWTWPDCRSRARQVMSRRRGGSIFKPDGPLALEMRALSAMVFEDQRLKDVTDQRAAPVARLGCLRRRAHQAAAVRERRAWWRAAPARPGWGRCSSSAWALGVWPWVLCDSGGWRGGWSGLSGKRSRGQRPGVLSANAVPIRRPSRLIQKQRLVPCGAARGVPGFSRARCSCRH